MPRARFISAIRSAIGKPYRWGGQGPDAFDCSGLVVWGLREAGYDIKDTSAAGLAETLKAGTCTMSKAQAGDLFFYESPISHVMVCLERWSNGMTILAGARGGGITTKTVADATKRAAFVDVTFGNYWSNSRTKIIDPFKVLGGC